MVQLPAYGEVSPRYMGRLRAYLLDQFAALFVLPIFVLAIIATPNVTAAATGLDYIAAQQAPDGSFPANPGALAVTSQSTAEVVRAYQVLGQTSNPSLAAALSYLNSDASTDTESLARKLFTAAVQGYSVDELRAALLSRYDFGTGGFGDDIDYTGAVVTTAFALQALNASGYSGIEIGSAINFLINAQQADGGWVDGNNDSAVYVTAIVCAALQNYRFAYSLDTAIARANTFLLGKRDVNGAVGEAFETALALFAIAPVTFDKAVYQNMVTNLQAAQLSDGSWGEDAYTTALALQALYVAANAVVPNPNLAIISGIVVDAASGNPLADVTITSDTGKSAVTDSNGRFTISDVSPSTVTLTAQLPGYEAGTVAAVVAAGTTFKLNLKLVKTPPPSFVTLTGTVVDAKTGTVLVGASVGIVNTTLNTQTLADGSFLLEGVNAGAITAQVAFAGYNSMTYSVFAQGGQVALGVVRLSPAVPLGANQNPVITSTGPTTGAAGTMYAYNVVASDPNGDALTYALATHPAGMAINAITGQIRWIPTILEVGTATYKVVVTDANAGVAEQVVSVTVAASGTPSYVITDVQTLNQLSVNDVIPNNYVLGTYVSGSNGATFQGVPCPLTYSASSASRAVAAAKLDRLSFQPTSGGGDFVLDLGQARSSVAVIPMIDHGPFPQEGIEYTVWGANDAAAPFPAGWQLGTLLSIYTKGYTTDPSCRGAQETDDYAGLYTFGASAFRYVRIKADYSIAIFDTPQHTTWQATGDDSGTPGWQSAEAEIDGVAGMVCDIKPTANAGQAIVGVTGQAIHFDASNSQGNIRLYGWDIDGDNAIDVTGTTPTWVFNAAVDADVKLFVLDDKGCVGTDTVHVTIGIQQPKPDLSVKGVDTGLVSTDAQTLQISGAVKVSVANVGMLAANVPALVTVFEDMNGNGSFDNGIDHVLGTATMPSGLAKGANLTFDVPVVGAVTFRDAALFAMVDSDNKIDEEREDNNVGASTSACVAPPKVGTFQPVVKFQALRGTNVIATPMVANLTDDNGDGKIDQNDIPDMVFVTMPSGQFSGGRIVAASGDDGHVIFTTPTAPLVATLGDLAIADIDGDGIPDIVAPHADGRHLVAFDNKGQVKWISSDHLLAGRSDGGSVVAIANLDGQGLPEIIAGASVYDAHGKFIADGKDLGGTTGQNAPFWSISVVADIDLDGIPEIVAGPSAYKFINGQLQLMWRTPGLSDGFVGIGNFNSDPYPEIVLVTQGKVYLLNHTGGVIWGPVSLPGGGYGGAPTIADFDGDGIPEIGIAGANRYVVLKANGTILWQSPTQDASSSSTGSTSFDFDGDGKSEIVYRDELYLRVYRGSDGTILFQMPLHSATGTEMPVVADVDNDGHAEILVSSDLLYGGGPEYTGVYVIKDANNSWVGTRKIWNQHSYHVTNINDDASVPLVEKNSWQTSNTYRLNAFPDRAATALPDLSASLLKFIDNGAGQPASLSVRVGNGGALPSPNGVAVSFYEGDPAANGALLGTVNIAAIGAGHYQDVRLDGISHLSGMADVYAVVDSTNQLAECNETNNVVHLTVVAQNSYGQIAVATNAASYGANAPVMLNAVVTNTGALPGTYSTQLRVEDTQGVVVTNFSAKSVAGLAAGGSVTLNEMWNTAVYIAGTYRVRAILRNQQGIILQEATTDFVIKHDDTSGPAITLRLSTDRALYHTVDRVQIESLVQNLSPNLLVDNALLRLTILDPSGISIFTQDIPLTQLLPGALRDIPTPYSLNGAIVAHYRVLGSIVDGSQALLASGEAQYDVQFDLSKALVGNVQAALAKVEIGTPENCTFTASNRGNLAALGLEVHYAVINLDTEQLISDQPALIDVLAQASNTRTMNVATDTLAKGNYACAVQAKIAGSLTTLAFAPFLVVEPPIKIDAQMKIGTKGRLLVLLDNNARCDADEDNGNDDHKATESIADCKPDNDPYGPPVAPTLSAQRAFLEGVLKDAGWSYTIVDTADAFMRAFRSGGYSVYALLSERQKLDDEVQKELREAVFRGDGLLVAGEHDNRNQKLNDALGVKLIGSVAQAVSVDIATGSLTVTGNVGLLVSDKALRIKRTTATSLALYRVDLTSPNVNAHDCHDEDDDSNDSKSASRDDDCRAHPETYLDAILTNSYGYGTSVFAGFDLLAAATRDGAAALSADVLRHALTLVNPAALSPTVNGVLPIDIALQNQGIATPARVSLTLPSNVIVIDADGAEVLPGTNVGETLLVWNITLSVKEQRTLTFYVQMPGSASVITLNALIEAPQGGQYKTMATPSLVLTVAAPNTLDAVRTTLDALILGSPYSEALKRTQRLLQKAAAETKPEEQLEDVIEATDALLGITDANIISLRQQLDTWLRATASTLKIPTHE